LDINGRILPSIARPKSDVANQTSFMVAHHQSQALEFWNAITFDIQPASSEKIAKKVIRKKEDFDVQL